MPGVRRRVLGLGSHWRLALFAATVLGMATAATARSQIGVVVGTGVALVSGIVARRELKWQAPESSAQRAGFALVGLGVVVTALWALRLAPAGFGFLGIAAVYFGLARLVSYWRFTFRKKLWPGAVVLAACAAAVVVGLPALSPGLPKWAAFAVGGGVLAAPVALNLLSA